MAAARVNGQRRPTSSVEKIIGFKYEFVEIFKLFGWRQANVCGLSNAFQPAQISEGDGEVIRG